MQVRFPGGPIRQGASKFLSLLRSRTLDASKFVTLSSERRSWKAPPARCWARTFSTRTNANPTSTRPQKKSRAPCFFATSAYVNHRWLLAWGASLAPIAPSFRFLQARSVPAPFPPVRRAGAKPMSFPGSGSVTTCSAMAALSTISLSSRHQSLKDTQKAATPISEDPRVCRCENGLNAPDLILSGGFDPFPPTTQDRDSLPLDVSQRAAALAASVKTDSFVSMSQSGRQALGAVADASLPPTARWIAPLRI